MNGGLGNQVFQYIFARFLELSPGSQVLIDDSHYFLFEDKIKENKEDKPQDNQSGTHNGYELEYVFPNATKPTLLSRYFDQDVWDYMVAVMKKSEVPEISIAQQILDNGLEDQITIFEATPQYVSDAYTGEKHFTPGNRYNSDLRKIDGNIYFYGYWINPGYLKACGEIILRDLTFRPITDARNKQYEKAIKNSASVGVHIRRGDFVKLQWDIPNSYYKDQLGKIKSRIPNATFFIFCDNIEWCKENADELGIPADSAVFVEGNFDYLNNYIDMQLMAMCDTLVVGGSSFSYLASLLNRKKRFQAIQIREPSLEDVGKG